VIHVSTTFEFNNASKMVYSRCDQPTRQRAEYLLGQLDEGIAVLYSSGMSAIFAALYHFKPRRVAIQPGGYFSVHDLLEEWYARGDIIRLDEEFKEGDLIWLETPKNPTNELEDIQYYVEKAHRVGAFVGVDSTFASPILQKPLNFGVDVVMHSCTKFLAGHSDVLAGSLVVKSPLVASQLKKERVMLGNVPGNLECFLLLRSLRTLTLRVETQSSNAAKVALYLSSHSGVTKVWHPSLPSDPGYEICKKQMTGAPGILSMELKSLQLLHSFLEKIRLFTQATSLGGVESLVDWRYRYDKSCPETLLRMSIGLEDVNDLIQDLKLALEE